MSYECSRRRCNLVPWTTRTTSRHTNRFASRRVTPSDPRVAMSAAGAGKPVSAPAREATSELASDTSAGHAASGLLMLQPNAPPEAPPPMYAPMHQVPVPVPEPHAPVPDRLPRSAAPPAQMPAGVLMRAGPGHGLPPPITTTGITPLAHMHMASPHSSASSRAAAKRPLDLMNVRPRPCPRRRRRRHHRRRRHRRRRRLQPHPPPPQPHPRATCR